MTAGKSNAIPLLFFRESIHDEGAMDYDVIAFSAAQRPSGLIAADGVVIL